MDIRKYKLIQTILLEELMQRTFHVETVRHRVPNTQLEEVFVLKFLEAEEALVVFENLMTEYLELKELEDHLDIKEE